MNYLDKVDRFETVRVALEIMLLNVWFIFHLQFYVYLSLTVLCLSFTYSFVCKLE